RVVLEKAEKGQAVAQAQAQVDVLEASLVRAKAEVPVESRRNNLRLAESRRRHAALYAPEAGVILQILTHEGEMTGAQPILRMGDTEHMVAVGEVDEMEVWRLKGGETARVRSRALEDRLKQVLGRDYLTGKVSAPVGRIVGRNNVLDLNPAADTDRRVVQ